ncbi:hypothetical protein [Larkinella soli]|nr:hypothetical protein [Larkinella soli]
MKRKLIGNPEQYENVQQLLDYIDKRELVANSKKEEETTGSADSEQ